VDVKSFLRDGQVPIFFVKKEMILQVKQEFVSLLLTAPNSKHISSPLFLAKLTFPVI